jgi:Ser/Thr protein kinase RdoA (MazF antagonist)
LQNKLFLAKQQLAMLQTLLEAYDLQPQHLKIEPFGSGLINHTWMVTGEKGAYILQRINKQVFKDPGIIADNLHRLDSYLKTNAPSYLFVAPLQAKDGRLMVSEGNDDYRLFPFIEGSHSVNSLQTAGEAYEAAKQFGLFSRLLKDYDLSSLGYPLKDFHNLSLRLQQFNKALANASGERKLNAKAEIDKVLELTDIASAYENIVNNKTIPLRVIHHDTKINNVLFDKENKGLCVIDLDTVMPGYFISDVGDMMRTYLSEANEEETDLDKVSVREDVFAAIYKGYMEEMGDVLTEKEKELFIYSGKFLIYMQAIRFLADYLNGDTYYPTRYPEHNLVRTRNQLRLLGEYMGHENTFKTIMDQA